MLLEPIVDDYNDFGILKQTIANPAESAVFLDLELVIEGGRIVTRTFQKVNNPYLYLPAHSAHAPGIIQGTVYGLLQRYYYQNSRHSDYKHFSNLLFTRLVARGWDEAVLEKIFFTAQEKIKSNPILPATPTDVSSASEEEQERIFFHLQYHPEDIPKADVRRFWSEELEEVIKEEIGIELFTIAYSRAPTIGSVVSKAKLYQVSGKEVSTYIAGEQA